MKRGTHQHEKGYIRVSAGPFRGKYLHRLVWEWVNGKPIPSGYDVHHKDGDPSNFHPGNLALVKHRAHWRETMKAGRLRRGESGRFEEVPF